jgi:long-subunit acyl-CoA synthetase (AMP-forming)
LELAARNRFINDEITKAVHRYNQKAMSNAQKVQKFKILDTDFTIGSGEMTPTMKIKRKIVSENHKNVIEQFYE